MTTEQALAPALRRLILHARKYAAGCRPHGGGPVEDAEAENLEADLATAIELAETALAGIEPSKMPESRFAELVRLHGRAWLAVHEWCMHALGERWMDEHDHLFAEGGKFYPPVVLGQARATMAEEFKAARR